MTRHDKVMLLGHSDSLTQDKNMQVTIAFNHFGEGLVQRMPRCRHGYFHVVTKREEASENEWKHWNWRSEGDLMLNGAYFTPSGTGASKSYAKASSLSARSSSIVGSITANAGVLRCRKGSRC
ncbi:putative pectate lyase [Helianthus annuus]|nr:putative pectate lyase [Helianthus annuus]